MKAVGGDLPKGQGGDANPRGETKTFGDYDQFRPDL